VERVGVGGRGKYPGAPPHHLKKELGDRKVPDRPEGESCEKKTKNVTDKSYQCYQFLALSLDIVSAYLKF
jgi:hypothetical protein